MNRYSDSPAIEQILFLLNLDPFGAAVILVGAGEHEAVAAALEEKLPALRRVPAAEAGVMPLVPFPVLVVGVGPPGPERDEALSRLNGRREWFNVRRQIVLILVDPGEMMDFQRRAGDLWAAPNFRTEVPYIADPDVDEAAARARLAEHLFHRHGRLDLRGFVRAESEDVSFRVEDVFVEVSAAAHMLYPVGSGHFGDGDGDGSRQRLTATATEHGNGSDVRSNGEAQPLQEQLRDPELAMPGALPPKPIFSWVEQAIRDPGRPLVVLGPPGAGKTFLLRWLALRAVREASLFGVREPVPVLVSFATFAQAPLRPTLPRHVVFSLLAQGQPAGHLMERWMEEGRVIFLFDGLDEVSNPLDDKRIREGLAELRKRGPRCPMILTSRVAGYKRDVDLDPIEVNLLELDDAGIRSFLTRWCELYAVDRKGESDPSRAEGRKEGERLAADVLANPSVRRIAGNPLLLTVLAVVHRAGVRLPEHRVDLYDHATRVLVERWNRVRSEEVTEEPAPPLKSADAVRLLGPLALGMVRSGVHATIDLRTLKEELSKVLEKGQLRGLATVDEAIRLFRESIGILVEQAPGVFAFLHYTLAEFFAALELVRTGELEKVAADPREAFRPEMREVMLLGAGVLGVLRAEDGRLATMVENLVASAEKVTNPASEMPFLILGLLADDPPLTDAQKDTLVDALIPGYWFDRWKTIGELLAALHWAVASLARYLYRTERDWAGRLRSRAAVIFGEHPRVPALSCARPDPALLVALSGFDSVAVMLEVPLEDAAVATLQSMSPAELETLADMQAPPGTPAFLTIPWRVKQRPEGLAAVSVSRAYDAAARSGSLPLALRFIRFDGRGATHVADVPLDTTVIAHDSPQLRLVQCSLPPPRSTQDGLLIAGIILQKRAGSPPTNPS